jgi:hypothetical protein
MAVHSSLFDEPSLCGLCTGYVNWSCYLTKRPCYVGFSVLRPPSLGFLLGLPLLNTVSRDSAVGIATGWSSSPGGGKNFHFFMSSRLALLPTQPPIQWVQVALSPGVKWQGREVEHSPPTSAEVKKTWVSTPHIRLHGIVLN